MHIQFYKKNHERHDLVCVRDDGTQTSAHNLETRSLLRHDLMHYCVEKAAGLRASFFAPIAQGRNFEEVRSPEGINVMPDNPEGMVTESVVARLQSAHRENFDVGGLLGEPWQGTEQPLYLTEAFIQAVRKEYTYLLARYESLKTGETLELEFPTT